MNLIEERIEKLIVCNLDCADAYEEAAKGVKDENFRNFLLNYAVRRKVFAEELIVCIGPVRDSLKTEMKKSLCKPMRRLLASPDKPSDIKDKAILRTCDKGEGNTISAYENALVTSDLNDETAKVLHRHRNHLMVARRILTDLASIVYQRVGRSSTI